MKKSLQKTVAFKATFASDTEKKALADPKQMAGVKDTKDETHVVIKEYK